MTDVVVGAPPSAGASAAGSDLTRDPGPAREALAPRVDRLVLRGAPDRPALTFRSRTVGYAALAEEVAAAATGLHRLGVRRGDRIAVYAEKRVETVVAMLAASAAGAVFVPVNPLFKARQLAHVTADCAAVTVVTTAERYETVRAALPATTSVRDVVVAGDTGTVASAGLPWRTVGWETLTGGGCGPVPGAEAVVDADLAAVFYTSGSTGAPKGVMLSHRNLVAGADSVAGYLGHTADDTILAALPLSFDAGFSQLTTALAAGAHVVLTNYLVPADVVRLCARHQVTGLTCVPPLWMQLAGQQWPAEAAARLRYFANTGGRMPGATLERLRELFPKAAPYLMYGLTEAFRSTYLDPGQVDRRPDSIGRAIPNAEVLVVRPDGTPCGPGEHGELVHRGALVSLGYWNDPERTAERFRPVPAAAEHRPPGVDAAWGGSPREIAVWSGDTVYRDEEGYLYFVGRSDEMIKSSGYRISPTDVEEAVYATGLVTEAVALGLPDERLGQHVVLVVSGPCDTATLQRALAADLPAFMLPRRTVVLDRLPRSVNGKFDRAGLRRTLEEG
ncbi:acyl-CoA ligase (AMP-forming), exosortase A system-associated [Streptomyces sp. PTM05]|uniref:Acyl-CoA ligase (AMP-forming), exosortase A system-associated n=1 Tax=Streptantibioticus parmotrematis TaxID=2873249 RepID=A0ABS7QQ66_9ACTN|nr:acyl-CoA ligase (AMP-forming), exosortase A system-associated [Streptantibioticus parmotrematis]MBY8885312.1 acyl-CoA ligase (AMP-forming), exosortase A system-associated [Streptantibioticus parmotrematis]